MTSYNISSWTIKKLDGFKIPLSTLYPEGGNGGWSVELPVVKSIAENGNIQVVVGLPIESELSGFLMPEGAIHVTDIYLQGEGSGTFYGMFLDMVKESRGQLEAVLVWEGGDSITRVKVRDGAYSEEQVVL